MKKLAPTGVASHNISGETIHRFFGMANRSSVPNYQTLDGYIKLYPKVILLIDEYSMISAKLLESLNEILIKTTQRSSIMGGVKTIFFGDIAQLPPIKEEEGMIWNSAIFNTVNRYHLSQPVRQQDEYFIEVLNKTRVYDFDESVIKFINDRTVHKSNLPVQCLRLYTTRELVRKANKKELEEFPGDAVCIESEDTYVGSKRSAGNALKETRLLRILQLKIKMPVMLITNVNTKHGWVNGTIATIEYIDDNNICLKKTAANDTTEERVYWIQRITRQVLGTSYTRTQFPIVPAFASTIHKSQSATIDCVGIHLDNMLTHGQLYVAMSRVRKAEDLYFFGADIPLSIKRKYGANCDAVEIIRKKVCVDH